jgi:hypothetical protein
MWMNWKGWVMVALLYRLVRVPVDIVLMSFDFFVLLRWKLAAGLSSLFGILGPVSGPFCHRRRRVQDDGGQPRTLCGHALRYGNRALFGLVCPWASNSGVGGGLRVPLCCRQRRFRFGFVRLAFLGAVLGAVWVMAARAVMSGVTR